MALVDQTAIFSGALLPHVAGRHKGKGRVMTRRIGKGLLVLGVAAGVAATGAWVPFLRVGDSHMSVSTAHGLCSTAFGQFAQAVSGQVQLDCTAVTAGYWGAIVVGIAGLALIVVGIIRISAERAQHPAARDQRLPYPAYPEDQGLYPQPPAPGQWQPPPPTGS
jgi:hypothetical protein